LTKIYNKIKEEKVIALYKQGKTRREIAKIVHMSLGDIGAIINKYIEDEEIQKNNLRNSDISEETKAMQLFSQGKPPIEVRIELNISTEKVEKFYKDYWRLIGLHQLRTYYETEIKENLPSFLKLFRRVKKLGMSDHEIVLVFNNMARLPLLEIAVQERTNKLKSLVTKKDILISEIDDLYKSMDKSQILLDSLHSEIEGLSSEINNKHIILKDLNESIDNLLSSEDVLKIKNLIIQTATSVLDNRQDIMTAAIVTAIQGIQSDPKKGFLINYLGNNFVDEVDYGFSNLNKISYHLDLRKVEDYLITHHVPILDLTNTLYDRILNIVQYNMFFKPQSDDVR
jgi:transposase